MGTRGKFDLTIRKKEEEIREYETKIREAKSYIQALQDFAKLLPRDEDRDSSVIALRPGSKTAKARDFLKEKGKPLHISLILDGIDIPNTKANRASLAGSLGSYARREQVFKNFGSNVFGLIGMVDEEE